MNVSQKCHLPASRSSYAAEHLGEPEIGPREDAEHGGHAHHKVEVRHHEIGAV